jgi:hypothetical protein
VVQDIIIGPLLQDYLAMIQSRPLCVVVLAPQPDIVAARESSRTKSAYRSGFESIEALDQALRHDTPRLGLWLDTSEQVPEQTVEEIIARAWDEAQVA